MLLSQPPTEIWTTFPPINLFPPETIVEGGTLVRVGNLVDSASSQWRVLANDSKVTPEFSISGSREWELLNSIEDLEERLDLSH